MFCLTRDGPKGELPGPAVAITRSADPAWNKLFLCLIDLGPEYPTFADVKTWTKGGGVKKIKGTPTSLDLEGSGPRGSSSEEPSFGPHGGHGVAHAYGRGRGRLGPGPARNAMLRNGGHASTAAALVAHQGYDGAALRSGRGGRGRGRGSVGPSAAQVYAGSRSTASARFPTLDEHGVADWSRVKAKKNDVDVAAEFRKVPLAAQAAASFNPLHPGRRDSTRIATLKAHKKRKDALHGLDSTSDSSSGSDSDGSSSDPDGSSSGSDSDSDSSDPDGSDSDGSADDESGLGGAKRARGNARRGGKRASAPSEPFSKIELPFGVVFELLPCTDPKWRTTIYSAGKSGTGKTVAMAGLLRRFAAMYPSRPIYGVCKTPFERDPAFRGVPIKQLPLDFFRHGELDMDKAFGRDGCFVLFDDWDSLDPADLKAVQHAIQDILNVGRKMQISCGVTSHLLTNYNQTRGIIHEADYVMLFPKKTMQQSLTYLCSKIGVPKEVSLRLRELGRWVVLHTGDPNFVLSEHAIEAM